MGRYTKQEEAQGLLNYINHAPTPYHSTEYLASILDTEAVLWRDKAWCEGHGT